jgi:NAD-dependent SIR2 family protein deacetylase
MSDAISRLSSMIREARSIVAFTGAGISTAAGIPDFRSPGGLYDLAKERYELPYPEAVFEIGYFKRRPEPFFELSAGLLGRDVAPTFAHRFLAQLEEGGKDVLVVTQNIDMLHTKAGSTKVIEFHGSYRSAHCVGCGKGFEYRDIESALLAGQPPRCDCGGIVKPDVVFFGEALPEAFYALAAKPPEPELFIALGTSLQVQPAASFALAMAKTCPSALLNRDETGFEGAFDVFVRGELDAISMAL